MFSTQIITTTHQMAPKMCLKWHVKEFPSQASRNNVVFGKSSHKQQKQADASPFLMSLTCNRMKGSRSAGTTNFHCSFANSNRISAGTGKILGCFKRRQNRVPLSLKGFCVLSWPWPRVKSSLQNFTCACGHKLNGQELNPVVMN